MIHFAQQMELIGLTKFGRVVDVATPDSNPAILIPWCFVFFIPRELDLIVVNHKVHLEINGYMRDEFILTDPQYFRILQLVRDFCDREGINGRYLLL